MSLTNQWQTDSQTCTHTSVTAINSVTDKLKTWLGKEGMQSIMTLTAPAQELCENVK